MILGYTAAHETTRNLSMNPSHVTSETFNKRYRTSSTNASRSGSGRPPNRVFNQAIATGHEVCHIAARQQGDRPLNRTNPGGRHGGLNLCHAGDGGPSLPGVLHRGAPCRAGSFSRYQFKQEYFFPASADEELRRCESRENKTYQSYGNEYIYKTSYKTFYFNDISKNLGGNERK